MLGSNPNQRKSNSKFSNRSPNQDLRQLFLLLLPPLHLRPPLLQRRLPHQLPLQPHSQRNLPSELSQHHRRENRHQFLKLRLLPLLQQRYHLWWRVPCLLLPLLLFTSPQGRRISNSHRNCTTPRTRPGLPFRTPPPTLCINRNP